jgi:tetratricopeptide (TPR) repeat protein
MRTMRGVSSVVFLVAAVACGRAHAEEAPSGPGPAPGPEEAGGEEANPNAAAAPAPETVPGGEEAGEARDPAVVAAQVHFDYGIRLARSENWRSALSEFDASIAATPNRSALYNRALCLRNLYQYPEAIEAFQRYLEFVGDGLDEPHRAEIDATIRTMREMLTPVTVTVSQPGATVLVDDREVGRSPLAEPVLLLAGPHQVRVSLPGYVTAVESPRVVTGRAVTLAFELREEPRQGMVRVNSAVDGAVVWVDGSEAGIVGHPMLLDAGDHTVEVRADGYRTVQRRVTVEADREQQLEVALTRPFRFPRAAFWSVMALATASTLATVGLGASVVVLSGEYDADTPDAIDDYDRGRNLMEGTDAVLGVTLVTAATALVMGFFTDWHRHRRAAPAAARHGVASAPGAALDGLRF